MKKKVLGIVLLSVCLLSACQGAIADKGKTEESEFYENSTSDIKDKDTVVYKDVTFANGYHIYEDEAVKEVTNEIKINYPTVEKDKLYAFYMSSWGNVEIEPQQEGETDLAYEVRFEKAHSEYVAKKALEMGLMVMPGYTFCSFQNDNMEQMYKLYYSKTNPQPFILGRCVVIGTMEQIENLFDYTEPIDGACWCLYPAMRPDIPEIVGQMGLSNEEIKTFYEGDGRYDEKLELIVGTEKVVTFKLPVIVPE